MRAGVEGCQVGKNGGGGFGESHKVGEGWVGINGRRSREVEGVRRSGDSRLVRSLHERGE